ncbi:phage holin family protein [Fulvivirga sp.]|uniref:phage holin family protein n=1 Tax=Fulvivirga sp. TaxID=1931237 RepID=UPI0032EF13AE
MNFIVKLLLTGISVIVASYLLDGVSVDSYFTAVIVAAVLALLNAAVKPILILFTIPITFLTLGLFLLVINAIIILLVDYFVPGFSVDGFWWALFFSIILAIVNSIFEELNKSK